MGWTLTSTAARKPTSPTLLSIPPELRALIFEFALTASHPLVAFRLDPYQRDSYTEATQPTLTKVNRQVREEALPIFYGSNTFVLHTNSTKAEEARSWLHSIPNHLRLVQHIDLWVRYCATHRDPPQGALRVSMHYDVRADHWRVDQEWGWVTVVKRPANVPEHAVQVVRALSEVVDGKRRTEMGPEQYVYCTKAVMMIDEGSII
ncbi:hypothetical protein MBLNU230_g7002t1 [Neophaeotheca triangularis]